MDDGRASAGRIAGVAIRYLDDPPAGDDLVLEHASPEELEAQFAGIIPIELGDEVPARSTEQLAEAAELIVRYSVHTSHPRFFNQNFAGPDPVAVAGDWLGAALNTTAATFEAAPVFTLIEAALLRKLARLVGYRVDETGPAPGLFAPGGSTATLYALQLARHRRRPEMIRTGAGTDRHAIFVSAAGHYAATKSAALLGMGADAVVEVAADENGAIRLDALRQAVVEARAAGRDPLAVIATAGTTVTSAFDPIDGVADICDAEGMWLHVDGCYGGSALFSPSEHQRLAGAGRSDSFVWNLHKMMGVTQQCTALLVRDPDQLAPCFATGADYLFQPDKLHGDLDSGDRHFQCARRVDSLKLWLTWHARGDEGFAHRIDHAVAMADYARRRIAASEELATVVAGDFTNVVFVWLPPQLRSTDSAFDPAALDDGGRATLHGLAPAIKERLQRDGRIMLGYQPVHGLNSFRLLVMNDAVTEGDVDAVLDLIVETGAEVWRTRG